MVIHISDKERKNTTINKIRTSLAEMDLRTVEVIEFVVDDLNGTVTKERLIQVYENLVSFVAYIYGLEFMFKDDEFYAEIHLPRIVLNLDYINLK